MDTSPLKALIKRALADKVLTRAERQCIVAAIAADSEISPEEHELLDAIVEHLSSGKIQVVD